MPIRAQEMTTPRREQNRAPRPRPTASRQAGGDTGHVREREVSSHEIIIGNKSAGVLSVTCCPSADAQFNREQGAVVVQRKCELFIGEGTALGPHGQWGRPAATRSRVLRGCRPRGPAVIGRARRFVRRRYSCTSAWRRRSSAGRARTRELRVKQIRGKEQRGGFHLRG